MGRDFLLYANGKPRIDADQLWPPFLERLLHCLARCAERGQPYFATYGFRSYEESAELHRKHLAGGPKAAPPGSSGHNFGIACDVAPDANPAKPGLQPKYDVKLYRVLVEEAPRFGLTTGAPYGDHPHVEIPGLVRARELATLRRIYETTPGGHAEKLAAVWAHLDAHPPAAFCAAA